MSTEINTRGVIRSMFSAFPSGPDSECLSKQELLSGSSSLMNISGGDTECVPMSAIGFKAYPCKSQADKAPLKLEDIPSMEVCIFPGGSAVGSVMYLSTYSEDVWVDVQVAGNTAGYVELPINKPTPPILYGACISRGDRIELYNLADMKFVFASNHGIYRFKINGNIFEFKK